MITRILQKSISLKKGNLDNPLLSTRVGEKGERISRQILSKSLKKHIEKMSTICLSTMLMKKKIVTRSFPRYS
jgi:hypothetical protein